MNYFNFILAYGGILRAQIPVIEYDESLILGNSRKRLISKGNLSPITVSHFRLAQVMYQCSVYNDYSVPYSYFEYLSNALWIYANLSWSKGELKLKSGTRARYRDFYKSFHAGRLGEAISWIFVQEQFQALGLCDLQSYILKNNSNALKNKGETSDFCFWNSDGFHILEAKGSWPKNQKMLKQRLKAGLKQNISSVQKVKNLKNHCVFKDHVSAVWFAETATTSDSTEIHYVDPPREVKKNISEDEKITMIRLYYSTWFSYIGLIEESKILGSNKSIRRDKIDKLGITENILNESYVFFKSERYFSTEILTDQELCLNLTQVLNIQFGISTKILDMLCGDTTTAVKAEEINFVTKYNEFSETYSDGTAVKWALNQPIRSRILVEGIDTDVDESTLV